VVWLLHTISTHNFLITISLSRLIKLRTLGLMYTVGLPKLFHTTATAVSQWSLLEKDSFAVGMHLMNLPTGVQ